MSEDKIPTSDYKALSDQVDYSEPAKDFIDEILPSNFEDKVIEFFKKNGYNINEMNLSVAMMKQTFSYRLACVKAKYDNELLASELSPEDFTSFPDTSVANDFKKEQVAQNIMIILARTGNKFRLLSWEEYRKGMMEESAMGDIVFSESDRPHFEDVKMYCKSASDALRFCKTWTNRA